MNQRSYIELYKSGELSKRIEMARDILTECHLCPRNCKVNRMHDERGMCQVGRLPVVSSFGPHFGEEAPLVGQYGSGTIFFTSCNLSCIFCQNWEISHLRQGEEIPIETLAKIMIHLQSLGCHNINFVTPTHFVTQILEALPLAIDLGLSVPLIYNSGGYDSVDTLKLLDGVFDIYMPDFKYWDEEVAERLSKAKEYPQVARAAIKEMHRQVGDLVIDAQGVAQRGLLVRHLVLPQGLSGSRQIMRFLAQEISPNTYVNLMDQYRPCGEAWQYPPISRRLSRAEYQQALSEARAEGIHRLDGQ
ncbi:MAG: radical SAM protein [bacterium]|nr:radical SAM protein [bacterium]